MSPFTKLTYHIVFATKHRKPMITGEIQSRLYEYIGSIIRAKNGFLIKIGGITDHVHIAAHLSPKFAVSDVMRDIKGSSSMWVNSERLARVHFEWQKGYGAFTVSHSNVESVRQ